MPTRAVAQLALDEEIVENHELEDALEERERRKESLGAVRAEFRTAHDAATVAIERLELPEDHIVRVGRFRISRQTVKGRVVSFETGESTRVKIALVEDE